MIVAVDILDEVEAGATALNGEIVRRALHRTCCNFVNNQKDFVELLNYYIALRLSTHYIKRRLKSGGYAERDYDRLDANRLMAKDARRRLKNLWPCAACIWFYNPTKRIRRFPALIC
ncbi:hypothetical protein LCGC14_2361610 [marine sediment metagenome]|uniref:Uncharacterized protein n=1 Tax=marine sediment metagenome TaxID=412755 RepID=A0A0F9EIZ1_9ZZZZ